MHDTKCNNLELSLITLFIQGLGGYKTEKINMQNTIKIFGAPGTGKTTTLINIIMESDLPIEKIAYVTFGRHAMDDMKNRMYALGVTPFSLENFRTIHGMNFKLLGIKKEQVADMRIAEFCAEYHYKMSGKFQPSVEVTSTTLIGNELTLDDQFYLQMQRDRTDLKPFSEVPAKFKSSKGAYLKFKHNYKDWMNKNGYIDFIGMIEKGIEKNIIPKVEMLCVDEWQDLNPLQVKQITYWSQKIPTSYHVGDDDQTIYGFSGADPKAFLSFQCTEERLLDETFRLPKNILDLSHYLISRNVQRRKKDLRTSKKDGGIYVKSVASASTFLRMNLDKESCFILVRNNFVAGRVIKEMAEFGVPFGGFDKEIHALRIMNTLKDKKRFDFADLKLLSSTNIFPTKTYFKYGSKTKIKRMIEEKIFPENGYSLNFMSKYFSDLFLKDIDSRIITHLNIDTDDLKYLGKITEIYGFNFKPVKVMTIHQSKGLEADNVILVPDITKVVHEAEKGESTDDDAREAERRIWYTAITRARKNLIVLTRTDYSNYKSKILETVQVFLSHQKNR